MNIQRRLVLLAWLASSASLLLGCNGQPLTTSGRSLLQDNARWQGRWVWIQGYVQDTYPIMASNKWIYTLRRDKQEITVIHQSPDPLPKVGDIVRVRGVVVAPLPSDNSMSNPRVAGFGLFILRREKT